MFLCDERHRDSARLYADDDGDDDGERQKWRTKDRMKTVSVALVLCLNIGVDPPDTMKISPCARMQCWINPMSAQPQNELDAIGKALQAQYERWQPRAKYKLQLDPTTEDMKKLCISCRRNAKGERVLLHYNGHGVPKPTANGEIWVFNKSYTQYIPLSVFDLQAWTGTPAIYVFDCSNAGLIVKSFLKLSDPSAAPKITANECILIAACGANEILPQSADLPADVFSACLTTPVKMALHWFCSNSVLRGQGISADIIDNIPGMQNNRKTPLGELNWIFTAITDTIAWNVLPRSLFQRLFRQDLLVASLFRNFLLAERIMRANNCTPVSSPRLPPTHQHPMWAAWDMAVEQCLLQMPALLSGNPDTEFVPSPFFTDQLTAFEVWLEYGSENDAPPEQLPIVLQVLLSQSHRLRALILLGRFLDLGLWAVELALSVGIFPYVLKLLQTTAPELRQILVFIWTKILALDRSCQADLVKDDGHAYFIRFLQSSNVPVEERAMAAFILAVISDGHEKGQTVCMASGLMEICLLNIPEAALPETGSPFFLRWLCLCLGKLWEDNVEAQKAACNAQAHAMLATLFAHSSPDARAAAVYSLGSLISIGHTLDPDLLQREDSKDDSQTQELMHAMSSTSVAINLLTTAEDASPMVRVETAVALSRIARAHKVFMREAAIAWKRDYDTVTARRVGMSTVDEDGDRPTSSLTVENVARSADAQQGLLDSHGECSDGGSIPLPPTYPQSQYGDDWMQERTTEGPKGGLYTQILQVLLDLATDAAPSVSAAGIKALMSVGLEMTHPIMEKATSTGSFAKDSSHLPALNIPRVGSRTSDLRLSPRNDSPLRRTTSTLISDHDPGYDSSGTLPRFGSHASLESLESPRIGGGSNDTSRFDHAHGDELPRSMIYKRSCAHFSMALLESAQEEEETPDTKRRADRLRRMYERMAETRTTEEHRLKMTEYVSSIDVGGGGVVPTSIIMHSLEPQAVAGDNRGRVHVWDHTSSRMVNKIETGLKSTDMLSLVNETDDALLLTGCVDGSVKIWRDYDKIGGESLVTAWNTLPSPTILPDTGSTGSLPMSLYKPSTHYNAHESTKAVIVWQQLTGCLYATGNAPHPLLRVWDVSSELCRETLSLQSQGTCLTAEGALLMAGTADGAVLSYDLRAPARLLSAMQTHTQPVISILLQPGGEDNLLITGCSDGQIKFCDLRNASKPFLTTEVSRPSAVPNRTPSLTALVGHPCARVIASGSSERAIKLWDLQGHNFASIQYTNSFLGQRIGSVTALSFHPNLMYLAAGSSAGHATIYSH
ncbi:predicted protein [Ostreococcus lucimarinus CCE9901]|uniref:Raptor N-terminal CASPase-like domain-containing protein n=1 Tax=Ostreococcus lucimarinus (strain CCE9901) TaxID=436017 RepID=A4RYH6_OSTLU|nr:predicted protein [Ostreococcus lucimarinus CCE9901]ABO96460.1 predicted protein [Ostreococcus lucimarinus CCE9901]|eukprot:XP_001418167.1 predicted protein [Ostreococcus lucimarinus CCE9901]